jgi:N-acetylmuramoyl-L-alanine amidase
MIQPAGESAGRMKRMFPRTLAWIAALTGLAALLAGMASASAQPQGGVVATSVQLSARPNGALLTLELSESVPFEVAALNQPDRLVIELPRVAFANAAPRPPLKAGPISAWRYGLVFLDRSRIVMDLTEPALVEKIEESTPNGRRRIEFHIGRVERPKFAEAARKSAERRGAVQAAAAPAAAPPPPAGPDGLPLVVIDPGHGGIDGGAAAPNGEPEKAIVLALAQTLEERLRAGGKVRVAMTRTADVFVSLSERVAFARDRKAALMVSIHADTLAYVPGVRGASVYTLSEKASDVISQRLAESENRADQAAGVETREDIEAVGDILFDLTKRETRHFSLVFARQLVGSLQSSTSMHKNPLRAAGFKVLKAPDVPSVLIEAGYLSSAEDARLMKSLEWRVQMAEAIANAIEKYIGENATGVANSGAKP